MRLTGQASTAIGNVITNQNVHKKFVCSNYINILLIMLLGDDSIILLAKYPYLRQFKQYV